ncbi:polysaccharide pyruvyl transferase family protein [Pseudobutyrivibrio xylanivorans]|uniref:Polysaccharide pyruvyl transferase family protein n=1 Tax=Pseudobutyrivibrio xylanivorans TaxID=185007 RepID=A0A5P6VUG6_PSEXY|nr:polysaccharide pyruvyl transferase family protein [Pseudobutyrivibrio xylanivorans]QFJ56293.1 polysaccharide pyruvyl transferase family protein [Pseudobutyrivibrio xylanivorans]
MKKIGILTFHFAYNYGAMLQAYALKEYLSDGNELEFINYQPERTRNIYTTNPFIFGMHPKLVLQRTLDFPKKNKQAKVFEDFKNKYLEVNDKPFFSLEELRTALNQHDLNVFGSDQIWNLDITGDTPEYYGELCNSEKCNIVYAGSFGHDKLTEKENDYISIMSNFDKISVRESYAKDILEEKGINSVHVCDPVFLLDSTSWEALTREPAGIKGNRFILYYTLKNDKELTERANDIAEKFGCKLISIHPNANKILVGKQLYGIGPQEFLWLIKNAEYICTNSFHASAFSLIFRKKLVHSQLEKGKGRVQSLLETVNSKKGMDSNGIECMDLSKIDGTKLVEYVNKSKEYLANIYEKEENN